MLRAFELSHSGFPVVRVPKMRGFFFYSSGSNVTLSRLLGFTGSKVTVMGWATQSCLAIALIRMLRNPLCPVPLPHALSPALSVFVFLRQIPSLVLWQSGDSLLNSHLIMWNFLSTIMRFGFDQGIFCWLCSSWKR